MDKDIAQILNLPKNVEDMLIGTLYDISVDDGKNHIILIPDAWTLKRFIEAGIVRNVKKEEADKTQYPYIIDEHVVYSDELALNLDNIAASYQETKKRSYVIPINDTLSTIDALYVKEKNDWYLFEFKNGDWKAGDIEKKVYKTIQLLCDLEGLDQNAVITTNRDGREIEIGKLNLKEKMEEGLDFEANSIFFKNRVSLYVIYTDRIRKAKEFQKICEERALYADMALFFEKNKIFKNRIVVPGLEMGDDMINMLAACLLKATSRNHYYDKYLNVEKMYRRYKAIGTPSYRKYLDFLEEKSFFITGILQFFSKKERGVFFDNMSADEFLMQLAVCSIGHLAEENMPECEPDEFDIIKGIMDVIIQDNYAEYGRECSAFLQHFQEWESRDRKMFEFVCSAEFTDEIEDLIKSDFYKALGRILLVQRMTSTKNCCELKREQQEMLLQNILHMEAEEAASVLDIVKDDRKLFLKFVAVKVYIAKKYTCFWNPEEDAYIHMCRQIYYIQELDKKEVLQGKSERKVRTYGCFGSLLQELNGKEISETLQKAVEQRVARIEQKILAGKSRMEMQPLMMAVEGTISRKDIALRQLQYSFEGSVFKKVAGCRGEDFCDTLGIS